MGLGRIGRRGLVAGVAALVSGGLAKLATPDTALAATMVTDNANISTQDTSVINTGSAGNGTLGYAGASVAAFGSRVNNSSTLGRFGVLGKIGGGVFDIDVNTSFAGVWGVNFGGGAAHGVRGQTNGTGAGVYADGQGLGIGVWADANSRAGVFGTSTGSLGVFGVSKASGANQTSAPPLIAGVAG